jgi:tryptophan-rich sensory protein
MKVFKFIIALVLPLLVGGIAGIFTSQSVTGWYSTLNKPSFNPPDWIFGPVWTVLYLLMGISFFIIWLKPADGNRNRAILVFLIQLLLNFGWSFFFFYFEMIAAALIEIIILWLSILVMILLFYRINRPAALLQIPYLLWVSFAAVLNGAIFFLNN